MNQAKDEIELTASEKSTLIHLNPNFVPNKCHPAISYVSNPREVTRSNILVRMLTGTYTLQTTCAKFNQHNTDICPLCKEKPEDLQHMILECPTTEDVRKLYITNVKGQVPYVYKHRNLVNSNEYLTQMILDPTHEKIALLLDLPRTIVERLMMVSRDMCYAIHTKRAQLINRLVATKNKDKTATNKT